MSKERTLKIGRREELKELIQGMRIEIDIMVRALRDQFEPRDAELKYTEKIDITKMKVIVREIERKHKELAKAVKELAMINDELGSESGE